MTKTDKFLGKISSAHFGFFDGKAQYGLRLSLSFSDGDCGTSISHWATKMPRLDDDMSDIITNVHLNIMSLLTKARKNSPQELVGTPIEVEIQNGMLKNWRILEEVLL